MDRNELIRRYELASGNDYKAIKTLAYEYIKECSTSETMSKHIIGMLMLINYIDSWVDDFDAELANRS